MMHWINYLSVSCSQVLSVTLDSQLDVAPSPHDMTLDAGGKLYRLPH